MKNTVHLICLEFKFLFRQKFLTLLLLFGIALTLFRMPRFHFEFNYDAFEKSRESRTETENLEVEFWDKRKKEVLEERELFVKRAQDLQNDLNEDQRYEREYFEKIEKYYRKPIHLETQSYSGWELFFLHQTSMSPHNIVSFWAHIMIVSAGLLLLTKDRENKTLFWASFTGKGTVFSSFVLKIVTVFFYGVIVQTIFNFIYILWLWLVTGYDMRHFFHLIQNISQFGMCDLRLNILQTLLLDMFLKCVLSILLLMFIFLFAGIMKRYIFLFMSSIAFNGGLYYLFYISNHKNNFDMWWRINPFHIYQLDQALTYHAVNIMNHAVDARVVVGGLTVMTLVVLLIGSYRIWRRYLYAER